MAAGVDLTEPLDVGTVRLRNRVFLAPMSGITDDVFRQRADAHGAGLVVSEMVASGELARGRGESLRRIRHSGLRVHIVQLAGREARPMADAARIAVGEGADIIDINMGCPAKKVTGGYSGSALMRNLDHAVSLIDAVVGAVDVPVTVKMRLGWDEGAINAPLLASRAENAGVAMVTVHGRTRCQFYEGKADWRAIARVKQAVRIPVVANGDVRSASDAQTILTQSGADAIMIGRASYGAPWIAGAIAAGACEKTALGIPRNDRELADYVASHYEDMLSLYGIEGGLRQARKHLGWYLDRHRPSIDAAMRLAILRSTEAREVVRLLRDVFAPTDCVENLGIAA